MEAELKRKSSIEEESDPESEDSSSDSDSDDNTAKRRVSQNRQVKRV